MKKIIRLTEAQLKQIEESTFNNGIDDPNPIPEYPHSQISVSGQENDEEFANPVTTDNVADKMCKSFPWGVGSYYRGNHIPMVQEGIAPEQGSISDMSNDTDQTGDGVKDMFNHADANELTDGNEDDDQQVIPHTVEMHLDRLIDAIRSSNLAPKKQMAILNKLIANTDIQNVPPSYKRETSMKVFAKK